MGVKPERADSKYHDVYYFLSRSYEKLGVFKPSVKLDARLDTYGCAEIREGHLAEVAASKFDQAHGYQLIPYTQTLNCQSIWMDSVKLTGSYQFYLPDASSLYNRLEACFDNLGAEALFVEHDSLKELLNTPGIRELEFCNFEEVVLSDMILGDSDHHFNNILEKEGKLFLIDNTNSCPWGHKRDLPSYKAQPLHWFKWRALPQADKEFSSRIVSQIHHLNLDAYESIMRKNLIDKETSSSIENIELKIIALRERVSEIQKLVDQHATIREIATALLDLSHNIN